MLLISDLDSKVAFLLLITAIPYNFLFVIVVIFTAKNVGFSWIFVGTYVVAAFVQVTNSREFRDIIINHSVNELVDDLDKLMKMYSSILK